MTRQSPSARERPEIDEEVIFSGGLKRRRMKAQFHTIISLLYLNQLSAVKSGKSIIFARKIVEIDEK
jgi:hypothetical protein